MALCPQASVEGSSGRASWTPIMHCRTGHSIWRIEWQEQISVKLWVPKMVLRKWESQQLLQTEGRKGKIAYESHHLQKTGPSSHSQTAVQSALTNYSWLFLLGLERIDPWLLQKHFLIYLPPKHHFLNQLSGLLINLDLPLFWKINVPVFKKEFCWMGW